MQATGLVLSTTFKACLENDYIPSAWYQHYILIRNHVQYVIPTGTHHAGHIVAHDKL